MHRDGNAGDNQPISAVITNRSKNRLHFAVSFTVLKGKRSTSSSGGFFVVDHINPGERLERASQTAFPGNLDGTQVKVKVMDCKLWP